MTHRDFYHDAVIRKAYTAKKLLDLAFLIQSQVAQIYVRKGMVFPVVCSSTLLQLSKGGPASVTEVARVLQHPHQTVAQHLVTLDKLKIVDKRTDESDRRRTEYFLTEIGKLQASRLDEYNLEAAEVFDGLNKDLGADLGHILDIAMSALNARGMADRFPNPTASGSEKS